MPNECPTGFAPTMAKPANPTVLVGGTPLSVSVTAADSSTACSPPAMINSTLPSGMGTSDSTNLGSRTRQFTWTPNIGQVGTYPITVTATDEEDLSTNITFIVYVGGPAEPGNPPLSQTNWSVAITNLLVPSSGNATVVWTSVDGVQYDVYSSTLPVGGGATWGKEGSTVEADASLATSAVANSGTRYYHVVPAGTPATGRGVWGVVRPTIPMGFSMFAPPLESDLKFNGQLGTNLAAVLPQNTQIYLLNPGNDGTWTSLYRNASGKWIDESTGLPYPHPLSPGQGFFISNPGAEAAVPTFSGPVGNDGTSLNTLKTDFNIIGLSEGKAFTAGTAFSASTMTLPPVGSYNDEAADQVVLLDSNGTWRRLIRRPTGIWYDTVTRGSSTLPLMPGQAYYYIRRGADSTVSF
jgi:hypothetical protein